MTQDVETLRHDILSEFTQDPKLFVPGSYGCHELLHVVSLLMCAVDSDVMNHGACVVNEKWFNHAHAAFHSLHELYQSIAEVHLPAIGEPK